MGDTFYGHLVDNLERDMYMADENNTSFVRLSFDEINNIIWTLRDGQKVIDDLEGYIGELNEQLKELGNG